MFGLVISALRARRTQTVAIFALTVLAALGGSAAPWFVDWGREAVAAADIEAAPPLQRVVSVTGSARYAAGDPSPIQLLRDTATAELGIADASITVGARMYGHLKRAESIAAVGLYLGYREAICDQLRIEGACPTGDREVIIGRSTADTLGLDVGDAIVFEAFRVRGAAELRISGIYDVRDVLNPYWAGTQLLSGPAGVVATEVGAAAFVSEATLLGLPIDGVEMDYHAVLPAAAFAGSGLALQSALADAKVNLRTENLELASEATRLIDQIRADQALVTAGVQVAALELVLLSWFALYLAVRHTSDARRGDIGLLKLRGSSRWRIWALTAQQSAVPMIAGVLVGAGLGYVAAALLAGDPAAWRPQGSGQTSTFAASAAVAGAVGIGSLVAAIVAEWRALRSPVTSLLRRVPPRRRGWRGGIGDYVIAALAIAGVYQGYAELDSEAGPSMLSLLAPGLVGLAVALLLARALPWLAARAGAAALRAGHSGAALSALHVARRPGTDRVFTVLAVCVTVAATTLLTATSAAQAWTERAELELGAPRVLLARAENATALLGAVRAADPGGDYAMAVAVSTGARAADRLLAVDSTRFARVAIAPAGYGLPAVDRLAELLHPPLPAIAQVTDGTLTLDVTDATAPPPPPTAPASDAAVLEQLSIRITLESGTGEWQVVDVGPLDLGRHRYDAKIDFCGGGCRLVGFEPVTSRASASVTFHALFQGDRAVVDGAVFGDIVRWRAPLGPSGVGPHLGARDEALTLHLYRGAAPRLGQRLDQRVLVADSPAPLPVVLAGDRPTTGRPGDSRLTTMGDEKVPYIDVGTAALLPRLGAGGSLVDLEYAQRSSGRSGGAASLEVWLARGTPSEVVDRIRASGIDVLTDTTVDDATDRFAEHGPGIAIRFQLFAALILLLLAAGAIVVSATVERRERARELRHLRTQGLTVASMRLAGYAATVLVVAGAIVAGLLAALAAHKLVAASLPVFTDDWRVLAPDEGIASFGLLLALGAAVAALLPAALLASARVVRSVSPSRSVSQSRSVSPSRSVSLPGEGA